MKIAHVDSPEVTDATCREKTGKTLKQWYAELDGRGGIAKGRRELVNHVYEHCNKDAWWSTTIVVEYERERGQEEKDGLPAGYSICSTKTVAAPLAKVFAAFGDAKLLDQWLGPKTGVKLEEGGTLENGDGDRFTFKKVRPQKDVKFTFERADITPATQVEVLFADKGQGKTGITLNHTRIQSRADADRLREGWSEALTKLKSVLEAK
jgi:uncharacterized protein YndB with AHSA1/START domain